MNRQLHSSSWHHVADYKPRLSSHVQIHRHSYRGQLWYVMQDRSSGRFQRFSPAAYLVITLMDGSRSVQEIWEVASAHLEDDALSQDEIMQLLSQLHNANVLYGDTAPDYEQVSKRVDRMRRFKRAMGLINPLAVRFPLVDPDKLLSATSLLVRPLFSWFGAVLFILVVLLALIEAGVHWDELTGDVAGRVLAAENLLLLVLAYVSVKTVHELAHGYAVKRWGGEVHEIGIMFLVFMPVPYVDASDASAFQNKWQRILVGSAGILTEVFLAALAMFVWVDAEEGFLRSFAYNVMLIGGVSTVFFNGNPLLRFDGYYVFSDWLEIPNLGRRSSQYVGYLLQRHLLGVKEPRNPAANRKEAAWLLFYAIASFIYRMFIMVAIALFVASEYPLVGFGLAIWSLFLIIFLPLYRQARFLVTSPVLQGNRARAVGSVATAVLAIVAALFLVPLPYSTVSQGVVWTPDESAIYAGADGIVSKILVAPDTTTRIDQPLIQLKDPLLETRAELLDARAHQLDIRHEALMIEDLVEAKIVREKLMHAEADRALAHQNREELLVKAHAEGSLILKNYTDLEGRFVKKGEILGYIAELDDPVIYVIVDESQAHLVRSRVKNVEVRFADDLESVIPAVVRREMPALSDTLPSMALSTTGGGEIAVDPTDPEQKHTFSKLLHLELGLLEPAQVSALGGRVYVRFYHGLQPVAWRIFRAVRQVFIKRLNV